MKNILIVILLALVGILGYMQFKPKEITAPVISDTTNNPEKTNTKPTQTETNNSKAFKTYTNTQYGFSFDYPSTWKLTEDKSKDEVTIDTNDIGGVNLENRDNPQYPSWSITFKATDKTFFTKQRVSTKVGIITYDENLKALMSESDKCLKATQLFGNFNGNNTPIQAIYYGGSLMSDPAYSTSAILTNNGKIIIVNSEQGSATTPEILNQMSKIASSFKLLYGNTVFVPACAK